MTTAISENEPLTRDQEIAEEEIGFASTVHDPTGPDRDTPETHETATAPREESALSPAAAPEEDTPAKISDKEFQRLMKSATDIDEMKAALDKRFDTIGGKIGGLERHFHEQKKTGSGKVQLTREHFKELFDEEDGFQLFGEKVLTGLNRGLEGVSFGSAGLTHEQVEAIIETRDTKQELTRLEKQHKDWRTVVGPAIPFDAPDAQVSPYWQWARAQGPEYYQQLYSSRDAEDIASSLTAFKASIAKTSNDQKPKTASGPTERERELRRAVQPKGAGGSMVVELPLDEEAAMHKAFLAERKRNS